MKKPKNSQLEPQKIGGVEGGVPIEIGWFLGLIRFDVSENNGGYPPKSSIFAWVFHYFHDFSPSILGCPYFWKHPC